MRNRHTFKAGFEYRYITIERAAASISRGSLGFSSLETGFDFASRLLGYPNNTSTGEGSRSRSRAIIAAAPNASRMGEIHSIRAPMGIIRFGLKLFS